MNNKDKILLCDVDDVLGSLVSPTLSIYNKIYDDNLNTSDITEWDITKFVKPECGNKIYDIMTSPSIYDIVTPLEGALDGINFIRSEGIRVVFVTAAFLSVAGRKFIWLEDNDFQPTKENYIETFDKSLIIGDYMIDDNLTNVRSTNAKNKILFNAPWNLGLKWSGNRANNWNNVIELYKIWTNNKEDNG